MLITHQLDFIQQRAQQVASLHNDSNLLVTYPTRKRRLLEGMMITLFAAIGIILGPADSFCVPVWPHLGILLGFLFIRGRRIFPWVALGQLLGFYFAGFSLQLNIALSLYQSLCLFFIYQLSLRLIGPVSPISLLKTWLQWCVLIGVTASITAIGWLVITTSLSPTIFSLNAQISILLGHSVSILIFSPLCLIWDNYPCVRKPANSPLVFMGMMVLLTHFGFCLSTTPAMVLFCYGASLLLMLPALTLFGQMGVCWISISIGLFLLTFIDLPGGAVLQSTSVQIWMMQAALLLCIFVFMAVATKQKQTQMQLKIKS